MRMVLTGGGTLGHVAPNLAIASVIAARIDCKVTYISSTKANEKIMIEAAGIEYMEIDSGKLRRYFDLRNFTDIFKTVAAFFKALKILRKWQPDLLFSKGAYLALPVVFAAAFLRIPIIIHESDARAGLTTLLCAPFAVKILLADASAEKSLKFWRKKCLVTGNPVREFLLKGSAENAKKFSGFSGERPVCLIMGGSLGAAEINEKVLKEKADLSAHFDIIHVTGDGKGRLAREPHYFSTPFLDEELADVYALANCVISRAGAGALSELSLLRIPAILMPLGANASRGDQVENAKEALTKAKKSGLVFKIGSMEKTFTEQLLAEDFPYAKKRENLPTSDPATAKIADEIIKFLK